MALTTRVVRNTGSPLYAPNNVLLSSTRVTFTLVDANDQPTGAFDATTGERVIGRVSVVTDANGEFSTLLWPNDRGDRTTRYACVVDYPGADRFLSSVASGASPLSWLEFKLAGAVLTPIQSTALDLHIADLTAHGLTGGAEVLNNKNASGGYPGLTLFKLNLKNVAGTFTNFFTNTTTAIRTWTMPDKDGTVSMLSDITAANTTVTQRTVGASTNLDTALSNLDDSAASHADSGFQSFGGAGNYYSIAANALTLLRPGVGFINGKKITWTAPQTVAGFTPYAAHWVYINSSGVASIATARTHSLYANNIILFEVYYDGVGYEVMWENHPVSMDLDTEEFIHETFGTVFTPVEGSNVVGADMVRVATGTGGAAGDRQIKIVGATDINDGSLVTNIPDSAGAAISWQFYYKNGSGQWVEHSAGAQFPMVYNNAGTPSALATSGGSDTGLYTCYAVKGEPNSGLPIYVATMHNAAVGTDLAAMNIVNAGTNVIADGALFQAMEPAQLGHVIVTNNVTSGFISTVNIAKSTARSAQTGGGTTVASGITMNTADFKGTLSIADTSAQAVANTVDKIERVATPIASAATVDLSTATGNFVEITGSTGPITSFGSHTAGHLHHILFSGTPIVTHHATNLVIPGEVSIQIVAGDKMILRSLGDGTGVGSVGSRWLVVDYIPFTVTGTGGTVLSRTPTLTTPKTVGYTVGTLPAGAVGMRAYVTDATAPTYLGALAGGGAITCPVFYNGAAWVSA